MATDFHKLTALKVRNLSVPGYHSDGGNLYLCVRASGAKSWIFRYRFNGKEREMGLGSANTFSLAEARERAAHQRRVLADGIDPLSKKRDEERGRLLAQSSVVTFQEASSKFIESHRAGWKNKKHADQWANTLSTYAYPIFGAVSVSSISTELVMRVLQPIWKSKTETASRLRGRIEKILDWSKTQGYRSGDNPAAWKGHLENLLPPAKRTRKAKHHAALAYQKVPFFMRQLQEEDGISAAALQFIILTCARTSEAIAATWNEFNLDSAVWTIPADRMKARKEHIVPLSREALVILETIKSGTANANYVFTGRAKGHHLSNMACLSLLQKRMGYNDLTVHGFRSSFRDWAGETTHHPREVIEHALAHQLKDKAEASYARGTLLEKRRKLMAEWANYCTSSLETTS